ncbi:BgTH12-04955 [Blumeria graminis f. sp. triticale]|uniref:BgTH12-04955 n=1 Tax=Blumeria graminis f. sp. triticale TaxID=1689686 RepID=A0A9W4D1S8_BLUGR|nr:BgTH12-04955 [Blumeria graminis f. sp. triticale]
MKYGKRFVRLTMELPIQPIEYPSQ